MRVWKILKTLEDLESAMADLYDRLHLRDDFGPEAGVLFSTMHAEEISHRDLVRDQRRLMFKAPVNFIEIADFDDDSLNHTLRAIQDLVVKATGLTLDDALRCAQSLEHEAREQHYRNVIARVTPDFDHLVKSLGDAEHGHASRLGTFARERGTLQNT